MGDAPVRMFITEDGDAYALPYTQPKTIGYVRADLVERAIGAADWELRDALTSGAEGGPAPRQCDRCDAAMVLVDRKVLGPAYWACGDCGTTASIDPEPGAEGDR
jgi:ribosomal protein S27AE